VNVLTEEQMQAIVEVTLANCAVEEACSRATANALGQELEPLQEQIAELIKGQGEDSEALLLVLEQQAERYAKIRFRWAIQELKHVFGL